MTARRLASLVPVLVAAAAMAGCGSSGDDHRFDLRTPAVHGTPTAAPGGGGGSGGGSTRLTRKEPITASEKRVIRGWATTLRKGHIDRAARYFALPAVVSNGFPPAKITSHREARQFNRILSCGAEVIRLERAVHHEVVTTFRLVNRKGPGARPCAGGGLARTAFRIRHDHITQWFRLPDPPDDGGASPAGKAS